MDTWQVYPKERKHKNISTQNFQFNYDLGQLWVIKI